MSEMFFYVLSFFLSKMAKTKQKKKEKKEWRKPLGGKKCKKLSVIVSTKLHAALNFHAMLSSALLSSDENR